MDCCPCLFGSKQQDSKQQPLLDPGQMYLEMPDAPVRRPSKQPPAADPELQDNTVSRAVSRNHSLMFATSDGPVSIRLTEYESKQGTGVMEMEMQIDGQDVTEALQEDIQEAIALDKVRG